MGIGAGLFLLTIGAILVFGIESDTAGWINFNAIGVILMLAGLLSLAMTFYFWRRRRIVHRVVQPVVEQVVVRETPAMEARATADPEYPTTTRVGEVPPA